MVDFVGILLMVMRGVGGEGVGGVGGGGGGGGGCLHCLLGVICSSLLLRSVVARPYEAVSNSLPPPTFTSHTVMEDWICWSKMALHLVFSSQD